MLFNSMEQEQVSLYSTLFANTLLFTIICGFIISGMRKKINVYDAFIEGAKEGFQTAINDYSLSGSYPSRYRCLPGFRSDGFHHTRRSFRHCFDRAQHGFRGSATYHVDETVKQGAGLGA